MSLCNLYGTYDTIKFTDMFESLDTFKNEYNELPTSLKVMSDSELNTIYYLLYANYGNSHIANSDTNQFKYKLFTTIFMYGPIWAKKLEIQSAIRALSLDSDDILLGAKTIYNHSYNPSTTPSTGSLEELTTIDDQNTTNYKLSKLDGYSRLYDLIANDVTKSFVDKFKTLFLKIVEPQRPLLFEDDIENM